MTSIVYLPTTRLGPPVQLELFHVFSRFKSTQAGSWSGQWKKVKILAHWTQKALEDCSWFSNCLVSCTTRCTVLKAIQCRGEAMYTCPSPAQDNAWSGCECHTDTKDYDLKPSDSTGNFNNNRKWSNCPLKHQPKSPRKNPPPKKVQAESNPTSKSPRKSPRPNKKSKEKSKKQTESPKKSSKQTKSPSKIPMPKTNPSKSQRPKKVQCHKKPKKKSKTKRKQKKNNVKIFVRTKVSSHNDQTKVQKSKNAKNSKQKPSKISRSPNKMHFFLLYAACVPRRSRAEPFSQRNGWKDGLPNFST